MNLQENIFHLISLLKHHNLYIDYTFCHLALAEYTYDRNCNPTHLRRYGISDNFDGTPVYEEIDNVVFSYSGNRVTSATDSDQALIYSGANDFSSGSSLYTWDANGNLVSDSGKGVVSVAYNRFNLPVAVDLGDRGDISFTYDGLGRKLSMSSRPKLSINPLAKSAIGITDGGKIDKDFPVADIDFFSRYYYDNLIFKGTQLERILFPGGYITPSGTEYIYHYYVTDRQGNVRAVVRDGNLVEANDYYPYGMLMADADGKIPDKQPYKLSGKEYITTRGLNLYDFGARMHDPAAMRFSTPDPLMEKYPSLSPYTYCAANPMKYIDVNGLAIYDIDSNGNVIRVTPNSNQDIINIFGTDRQLTLNSVCIERFSTSSYYENGSYGFFDYYRIRGDENSYRIFKFMFRNTNVEWSLFLTGNEQNGLGFLTTSHDENHEFGCTTLFNKQLQYNYFIREFSHSHPGVDTSYFPSGIVEQQGTYLVPSTKLWGDIYVATEFARIFAKNYKSTISFYIWVNDDDRTKFEYSGSSRLKDFRKEVERCARNNNLIIKDQ